MNDINLPPLPRGDVYVRGSATGQPMWAYSESHLHAYARAAVLADRERRNARPFAWHMTGTSLLELATHETLPPEDTSERAKYGWVPLYLAPQPVEQRQPLSDEQIERAYRRVFWRDKDRRTASAHTWIEAGIREAERLHGIVEGKA